MRARGLSSCATWWSSDAEPSGMVEEEVVDEEVVDEESAETWTNEVPSWVLSRRRAVLAAVGFSKVTAADWVSPEGETEREEILPL